MNREILFRGKRPDNGAWVEGGFVQGENSWIVVIKEPDGRFYNHLVYRSTVGQYTGLTDKNGVKIFEGDKCRVTRPCVLTNGNITFSNGCFWFVDDGPGGMLRLCDIKPNGFEIEVIGNIHNNPELIGGEDDG